MPDHAPQTKIAAIERLGGRVVKVPFDRWWQTMREHRHPGIDGLFIHPVSDPDVIAGNGTIGLEILEDLPDVDTVLVPFGGGGLSCGIASAVKALRPGVSVFACEVETAAPLAASLAAGAPQDIAYRKSFVDGIGSGGLLPEMWPLAQPLLDGSLVVTLEEVAARRAPSRRAAPRDRGGRRGDSRGGGARRSQATRARSSASCRAATSTRRRSRRSSRAARPD